MGKTRSKQFFARQQYNLRKQKEKEEKEEKQKQQQRWQQLQEEAAKAHEEVERLEANLQILENRFEEVQDTNNALERGNRENQAESIRLHEEIRLLQNAARRRTKKRN